MKISLTLRDGLAAGGVLMFVILTIIASVRNYCTAHPM